MTVATIERIGSPEIPVEQARKEYIAYRRALQRDPRGKEAKDYAALMRGYRAIAKGQQVIDLHRVMTVAGLQDDTQFPKLAIGRADWAWCHCSVIYDGGARFMGRDHGWRRQAGEVRVPQDTFPRPKAFRNTKKAMTPIIPPSLRPVGDLSNFYILWDAVWQPAPPVDPLLLKHLGGALYAILAAWDLTPLEQAVMRGRL